MKKILLLGSGGHSKSCIDLIESDKNFELSGIVSKSKKDVGKKILGYKIIASDSELSKLINRFKYIMIGVGFILEPEKKKIIYKYLKKIGFKIPKIISSKSKISKYATIKEGVHIFHDCVIGPDSIIKEGSLINNKTLIEHDVIIEKFCHISTGCIINGESRIGTGSFVGSGSVVVNKCKILKNSFLKMGSIIKK